MKTRTIKILGFSIDIYKFGKSAYMYPSFNGNAEFKVTHTGFRQLHHYLRTIQWMQKNSFLIDNRYYSTGATD